MAAFHDIFEKSKAILRGRLSSLAFTVPTSFLALQSRLNAGVCFSFLLIPPPLIFRQQGVALKLPGLRDQRVEVQLFSPNLKPDFWGGEVISFVGLRDSVNVKRTDWVHLSVKG
ncbi:hypothetical protein [Deinococcus sp. QL22]|uniref:hypothetical protein n=1 Tax=Deinococcus sp. QL22 TaxID=2939437 RepID=UPI002017F1F9|nr:hypothetical protein [Deinococcus sp. QL22]UQN08301.1 hypothetical protein M1R55_16335 [Deinococcus sp. QL22]